MSPACAAPPHLDLVRSLGADQVIDYTVQDPDLGLDDVRPDPPARRRVYAAGYCVGASPLAPSLIQSYRRRRTVARSARQHRFRCPAQPGRQTAHPLVRRHAEDTATLDELRDLIEAAQIKPVIDSEYPLERAADAIVLVKDGRPAGKVVVKVSA